jgi:hypothetical protein
MVEVAEVVVEQQKQHHHTGDLEQPDRAGTWRAGKQGRLEVVAGVGLE